ncbi:hypothetical protein [Nostoc favosum]|uniref:Uncharacterized protein n=1 Tax=Nostoc favosum CHAB5714 TaxID=2780399 RepID=A0ABS8ILP8_9NOSO|nr:hypothetical protein [Nostoc favosum]MCC5604726.1 hypothetical protein [Nostoc favosum CHAB5714]
MFQTIECQYLKEFNIFLIPHTNKGVGGRVLGVVLEKFNFTVSNRTTPSSFPTPFHPGIPGIYA